MVILINYLIIGLTTSEIITIAVIICALLVVKIWQDKIALVVDRIFGKKSS